MTAPVMRSMVDGNSNEAEKRGGGGGERWGWRQRWRREAELEDVGCFKEVISRQ